MKQLILEIIEILNGGRGDQAVRIAELKSNAGNSIDSHLIEMHNAGTITLEPFSNPRMIKKADKEAATMIHGEACHRILVG